jgi:hypothetical protein
VGNLYQIVQFDTPADDGRVHNGAVYRGIGPDFDIVFQYDNPVSVRRGSKMGSK